MSDNDLMQIAVTFDSPDSEMEERESEALNLFQALRELEEVEAVSRVLDPNPPRGNKAVGGFIIGLLTAEVSVTNFKKLMGFLGDRVGSKPIKLKLKAPDGRELELEASSQAEFEFAFQKAQEFLGNK
jgi:ferric-dicitrate binding protein FerR (iron transport regulator)